MNEPLENNLTCKFDALGSPPSILATDFSEAAVKRVGKLVFVERIRLLCDEFEVRTNSRAFIDRLAALNLSVEQALPLVHHRAFAVEWVDGEYRLSGDGMYDEYELSVTRALETLLDFMHRRTMTTLADHIGIRAALGNYSGKSFLIVGARRSGKSTLAVRLLMGGTEIAGDELALLRQSVAFAFPRRFLLGGESLPLLPKAAVFEEADSAEVARPDRLITIEPQDFGKKWLIGPAPVNTIVFIEPNFGQRSRLVRCGKVDMVRRVLPHCTAPVSMRKDWVRELSATIDHAETYVVELGDPDAAMNAIQEVLN